MDHKNANAKNEYSIYDFFRGHPGTFAACISAIVAVLSFVFNFAASRYNYEYLTYWGIDTVYATETNKAQIYLLLAGFVYFASLMVVHSFLSQTVDAHMHYRKHLKVLKSRCKLLKKEAKALKSIIRSEGKSFNQITLNVNDGAALTEEQECLKKYQELVNERNGFKLIVATVQKRVLFIVTFSCFASFVIGLILFLLTHETITWEVVVASSIVVAVVILLDLLVYSLLNIRHPQAEKEQEKALEMVEHVNSVQKKEFPLIQLFKDGLKGLVTNTKIKSAVVALVVVTILFIFMTSANGKQDARDKRDFLIYDEGTRTYAVIYNAGNFAIMERATIEGQEIKIDITKQRKVSTEDIEYNQIFFEKVTRITQSSYGTTQKDMEAKNQ